MSENENKPDHIFTEEDLYACWRRYKDEYLIDILNGEYTVEEARKDLRSLIGSKFDPRIPADKK